MSRTFVTLTITVDVDTDAARSIEPIPDDPPIDGAQYVSEGAGWLASRLFRDVLDQHALDPGSPEARVSLSPIDPDSEF